VVGPFWVDGNPPKDVLDIRDRVRAEAAERSVLFIDPIAEQWVTSENQGQITGPDGTHPTQYGHQQIADRLAADLAAAGVQLVPSG
jgi:lysophospholipase L1-like esterase